MSDQERGAGRNPHRAEEKETEQRNRMKSGSEVRKTKENMSPALTVNSQGTFD